MAVGKRVRCPKCKEPFVVRPAPEDEPQPQRLPDDDPFAGADFSDEEYAAAVQPAVPKKRPSKEAQARQKAARARAEARERRLRIHGIVAAVIWINAHLAVGACLLDSGIQLAWLVTHFDEVYRQVGLGRLAVRQVGRELLIIGTAVFVWFQGVLFRDRLVRGMVVLFGVVYLVLFGLIGTVVALLAEDVYERSVYAIPWSVIYLGVSLLVFAAWGYGPETSLERAERLTSLGRYDEALAAASKALDEDPDDEDALELERTLRDMLRCV